MGAVFRKTVTKALPSGAELFVRKGQRFARWKNAKQRTRTAPLTTGRDGQDRIVVTARTYSAKYRNGSGVVRVVPTGCKDETAARSILADLERRAVRVKSKMLTAAEDAVVDHLATPLRDHIADYLAGHDASGTTVMHRDNVRRALHRVAADCNFATLADLNRSLFDRWLIARAAEKMGARTRNTYRAALVAFCNWSVLTGRLVVNPFTRVKKADEESDPRRKRRSLTEAELVKLLDVARRRPLRDAMTIRRGKRKGEITAKLRPEAIKRLELLGLERALIYKTLVLTGLRKSELASLTAAQLHLDGEHPFAELAAADEKNRQGSSIPLRADLAADLRRWLADRAAAMLQSRGEAQIVPFESQADLAAERQRSDSGESEGRLCPQMAGVPQLPLTTPLFNVPDKLVKILNRDLLAAGIAKRDERGRTIDVHALRTSFGTLLSKGGVTPRTAQAAMRHSTINLTMNAYTDPKLLDVHGALESLPLLPLGDAQQSECRSVKATGAHDLPASQFAPGFAPTRDKPSKSVTTAVKMAIEQAEEFGRPCDDVSGVPVEPYLLPTITAARLYEMETKGLEPSTPSLQS